MSEWKEYKLSDVTDFIDYRGKTPIKTSSGIPLITAKIVKNGWIQKPNEFISKDDYLTWMTRGFPKVGDVVLTTEAPLGEVAQIKDASFALAQRIITIRGKANLIENGYLKYFLQSSVGQHRLKERETGTTVTGIKSSELKQVLISAPDFQTQTEIAEILSSLDDKIELNNKINQELETLAQTLFKQWFIDFEFPNENGEPYKSSGGEMVDSDLGEIPKGWEVGYLEDVIVFHNGYAFTSKELESDNSTESYHVFKMGHIKKGGGLNAEGTKSYFSKSKAQKLSKYVLKKGDLLMCMTDMKGNVALLGHTALMNEDDKYIVNQRVGLLRPKNDVGIDYPYLYILTNSFDFIEELRSRANSGVQVNLSTNEIKKSKILIAPKSINEKFDLITKSFYDKIFEITNENETLRNTRDFLLPKLISGELVINEINN
jgi:type I restriction enzyme S subunit